jgi:LmbE family N-acetylglucosaminyl deacetylase
MPRAVALSPHLDDAAFSCGGTLARLAQAGWEVAVCTAFTLSVPNPSGFALACQLDKGLPPEADYMAIRRAEDAHVDHVQLVLATRAAVPEGVPVLWWTDFPYSARSHSHPAQPFAAAMRALPERAVEGDMAARHAACAAYATQLGFQFGGAAGLARALAEAGAVERLRAQGAVPESQALAA